MDCQSYWASLRLIMGLATAHCVPYCVATLLRNVSMLIDRTSVSECASYVVLDASRQVHSSMCIDCCSSPVVPHDQYARYSSLTAPFRGDSHACSVVLLLYDHRRSCSYAPVTSATCTLPSLSLYLCGVIGNLHQQKRTHCRFSSLKSFEFLPSLSSLNIIHPSQTVSPATPQALLPSPSDAGP